MGLFEFVKGAGEKLFGMDAAASEKENNMKEFVNKMGLEVADFKPTVEGETVCIEGTCADMATKEKLVLAVGNVDGILGVQDKMAVTDTTPAAQFYTVVSGDSLSKISKEFYGDPMKYNDIFEANKPMLSHPDKIYPGQVLRVPNEVTQQMA